MLGVGRQRPHRYQAGEASSSMDESEIENIAKSWITLHKVSEESKAYEENFWAYDRLCELCEENPDVSWKIIDAIRSLDSSDLILSNLAAGPLEDLLSSHGEEIITHLEKAAVDDRQLRKLLGAVWQNAISEDVWSRIKSIADQAW